MVIVYRFDRFARSTRFLVNTLEEFRILGVQFVSVHESIDTATPIGKFAFNIFAAIAEFERELIRQRVRSGVAHARSRGVRLGRPPVPLDVVRIESMRKSGASWRKIGTALGVSHVQARRALQDAVTKSSEIDP
jgi:DNA invertase Pin-like site-specific DNA recombinase